MVKWVQKACQDYKESKDCDVECGLCDCSTGTGTYPEHCSSHGRCIADCTLKPKNNKCYQARCECYPGWKGKKCEIPSN